jgi:hypothetical protein
VALNLWKIGGKPTSYNPLPTGWTEVSISGYKSYTMTFRAKSASSASITLYARMGNELVKTINLTPVLTTYSASVDVVTSNLFSIFNTNATDIIIDSIELVQKPLPKLTLNGVDGFMSGKWGTSSHGTVIDDMTYSLNATVAYENITCVVPVLPNTTYSFSLSWSGNTPAPRVQLLDVNGNDVGNPVNGGANNSGNFSASFTTTSTTVNVRIYAQANSAGLVTFKNLMLNLGSTPAPYSRKTGDKMVLPVARKNLFDLTIYVNTTISKGGTNLYSIDSQGFMTTIMGSGFYGSHPIYKLKPNTNYVFSVNYKTLDIAYEVRKVSDNSFVLNTGFVAVNAFSFTTGNETDYYIKVYSSVGQKIGLVQLEEGTLATGYTPYDVQASKKLKRYVPKKNLLINDIKDWTLLWTVSTVTTILDYKRMTINTNNQGSSAIQSTPSTFSIVSGKTYTLSYTARANRVGVVPNYTYLMKGGTGGANKSYSSIGTIPPLGTEWARYSLIMTADNTASDSSILFGLASGGVNLNGDWIDVKEVQFEEGGTATSYEPFTQSVPKARTGVAFNGVTDYISVNDTTFETIGVSDFSVESVLKFNSFQVNTGSYMRLFDKNGGNVSIGVSLTGNISIWLSNWFSFPNTTLSTGVVYKIRVERVNGTVVNLYINNVYKESITVPSWVIQSTGILYIGNGSSYANASFNGIYYSFVLKKNGTTLLNYDFTNPSNIVGSTVLQSGNNLIPNFEDARWSLHANTQVLGKHLLRLNAQTSSTDTFINIPVKNGAYKFSINTNGLFRVYKGFITNTFSSYVVVNDNGTLGNLFTVDDSFNGYITLRLTSGAIGTFDFSKIQLYALSGTEGTLNGTPISARKQSRRTQYAKR